MASPRHTTHERVLRDADRRKVESNPDVTGDSEQSGMQTAMTVDQQNVRCPFEATNGCLDSRKFAISQVCWDVRNLGVMSHRRDVDWIETLRVDAYGHDIHRISVVACVDAGDTFELPAGVLLDDTVAEHALLLSERGEEADGF